MGRRIEPELWDHWLTGEPDQVLTGRLCASIGQYAREYNLVYVGRTKDPSTRMSDHRRAWVAKGHRLHHMIKIYKTRSFASMVRVEAKLIDQVKANNRNYRTLNQKPGDWRYSDAFCLYLLVDDENKKTSLSLDPDYKETIEKGLASVAIPQMEKLIEKHSKDQKCVYVGFTDNPEKRFSQHQKVYSLKNSWSKMIVLFKGRNLHDTYHAENELIRIARKKCGLEVCYNDKLKHEAVDFFFVYVLVGRR